MTDLRPRLWVATDENGRRRSVAARHAIFCRGGGGEVLERCRATQASAPHDEYDRTGTLYFGADWDGETIATARLVVGGLPTGEIVDRLPRPLDEYEPGTLYSEASRFGMLATHQKTRVGREAFLGLVGVVVDASVRAGYEHHLLTLRPGLFWALAWAPWGLSGPFDYPPEVGGPLGREPSWAATLNLHELVAATRWHSLARYRLMFPTDPPWLDRLKVRPRTELEAMAARNQSAVRSWEPGTPPPRLKAVA